MKEAVEKFSGVIAAVGIIGIIGVMIIPLPSYLLDILLALNITLALIVIMVSMYTSEPLQFSVFPGLLLIMTLFRLSLNIASTRLILSEGYAGDVIEAFGTFVISGNYVVGFIIFLILVIINFVVITKGAGRIAEVSARFTLDALPGKQMAIDADLNAGLIDDRDARERREKISREADFYGAMDGASKFVRGDAIAGLIITIINIVGGLIIGVGQNNMELSEAVTTYTKLTVGDGLVTQIPALLISTASGLIVSRAASDSNVGQAIITQLLSKPRALGSAAVVIFIFGLAPGLPTLPFFILSIVTGGLAYTQMQTDKAEIEEEIEEEVTDEGPHDEIKALLQVDPLELEIGYGLIHLVDESQGGDLLHRVSSIRKQMAMEMGIIVPPIRIRDNLKLASNDYMVRIRGNDVAKGEILPNHLLVLNPEVLDSSMPGEDTTEPTFGMPAKWIPESQKTLAEAVGATVVDPETVLATHLMDVFKLNANQLLSRQDVQVLINNVKETNPTVVDELIPGLLNVGTIQKVLQNLLKEKVPLKDLVYILEVLADFAPQTKDPELLTEYLRTYLAETISQTFRNEDGRLYAITLDPSVESEIVAAAVPKTGSPNEIGLPPDRIRDIYKELRPLVKRMNMEGRQAIVICSPQARPFFRALVEPTFPTMAVLSYSELTPQTELQSIGMVSG
ncbi:MAG: flagellar biosynthesis protein FlhA [Candidatus Marinimicrobia bacterium]|nr:flagellar biosynthesis protein FlhA [Candidatus Neomarinimicrobiota bacterium]